MASAQGIPGYPGIESFDVREIRLLPAYCVNTDTFRDRIPGGRNGPLIEKWYAQMGPIFGAMHHYCYGLMRTNRAVLLARDAQTRSFYLRSSITEFDYVISRAPDDFYLLPEILAKKGENLIRLGLGDLGVIELERAISLNAAYWPPYAYISDFYKGKGELGAAREWLQQGLEKSPDAKGLLRRLAELEASERRDSVKR